MRVEPLDSPAASELLNDLDLDLDERYGNSERVIADVEEFEPPTGAFLVVYVEGEPVACGGFRRLDADTAELKRMYVRPAGRGRGLARRLLAELEQRAATAGYRTMWLETGVPQHEALGLYSSAGYEPIDPFGQFAGAPDQRCFGKALS